MITVTVTGMITGTMVTTIMVRGTIMPMITGMITCIPMSMQIPTRSGCTGCRP